MRINLEYIEKPLRLTMIWTAAMICFFAGLYIALNHTFQIFDYHNYVFSPLGDDSHDAGTLIYPILLGQEKLVHIVKPFADHRIIIERLLEIFDFTVTNGLQSTHPYRVAIVFWLVNLLFIFFAIIRNAALETPIKFLLSGVCLSLTFASTSITNYFSAVLFTWPLILLFSLLAFIFTAKYCQTLLAQSDSSKKLYTYILLTFICTFLAMISFNIGLIIWPIVFLILIKQRSLVKRHTIFWIICAVISYGLYFYNGWKVGTAHMGFSNAFHRPIEMFLYMSRVLSLPLIPTAPTTASLATIIMALFILSLSLLSIILYLMKKRWSVAETIIFSYLVFSFLAIVLISIGRFWMKYEALSIGARFTTPSFILMLCLLTSFFLFQKETSRGEPLAYTGLAMFAMLWLVAFFIPNDYRLAGMFNSGVHNQFSIVRATGIPIDAGFIKEVTKFQNNDSIEQFTLINNTEKNQKKGPYTFWPSDYINHSLSELDLKKLISNKKAIISPATDFRVSHNPGLFMTVELKEDIAPLSHRWDILFTNKKGNIIGFALSAPQGKSLWDRLTDQTQPSLLWRGALNTHYLNPGKDVMVWAVDKENKILCKLGRTKV